MEAPYVQMDSISVQTGFSIVNIGVHRTGVVGVKVINLSHSECQLASTQPLLALTAIVVG